MRYPQGSKEELKAPPRHFRVLAVGLQEGSVANYLLGDFPAFEAAEELARQRAAVGSPVYVFNDRGDLLVRYGSWH